MRLALESKGVDTSWNNGRVATLFNKHIGKQRRVVLLQDSFSAHLLGIEAAPAPLNIKVVFSLQTRPQFTSPWTKESFKI
jgi:hypothetical protein